MTTATRTHFLTLPPPTPNGGLHMGHLAGPFLAGDVYARARRLDGDAVKVLCYSDTNQSYVRVTAEQQGRCPTQLAHQWTEDILETLDTFGIGTDAYFEPDADSNGFVRELFLGLYEKGRLARKPIAFFWSPRRNAWLDEAGVTGFCPVCLAGCKCGICEACGHTNTAETLVDARETVNPDDPIELRHIEVLVLETERWRDELTRFYASGRPFRVRYRWLAEDALAGRLPDFPVSVPGDWGIAMDHPDFPSQVINAWPEIMADFVYGFERLFDAAPKPGGGVPDIVNFFGFDNSYFYAIVHAALLIALDREPWLPRATLINEFYNLEQSKFSTSGNHVLWAGDMARRYPPDLLRFYTAFSAPGFETGNFAEAEMVQVVEDKLSRRWRTLAQLYNRLAADSGLGALAPSEETRVRAAAMERRIRASYGLARFHLRQAAVDCLWGLEFVLSRARAAETHKPGPAVSAELANLRHLLLAWARAAWPLMPRLAIAVRASLGAETLDSDGDWPGGPLNAAMFDIMPERSEPAPVPVLELGEPA